MTFEPIRKIEYSRFRKGTLGRIDSISLPKLKVGFALQQPSIESHFKGVKAVFMIGVWYDLIFSADSDYSFHLISTNEIIDNGKPLSVNLLTFTAHGEMKDMEAIISNDIKSHECIYNEPIKLKYDSHRFEADIREELDRFLKEG